MKDESRYILKKERIKGLKVDDYKRIEGCKNEMLEGRCLFKDWRIEGWKVDDYKGIKG